MSRITITCPDCGRKISIDILTIDTMRAEIQKLKAELYKLQEQVKDNPFDSLFGKFTK